ncbi:MAG: methyltransferase domain-containing protein [Candidatus Omnitrophica bacterium]|nr:methyltransferase domain-containing protein [Candidatus Omnitrophota bacterium]
MTRRSRREKFDLFVKLAQPRPEDTILDVGVIPFVQRYSNFLELWYPYPDRITALTTEPLEEFSAFREKFPLVNLVAGDGKKLDFADNSFDIVFSNAVIEHVGGRRAQAKFLHELIRVGKKVFVTTPNYFFPVDSHTLIPLVHLLPVKYRYPLYRMCGRSYYADVNNLNLIGKKDFLALFPPHVNITFVEQKLLGLCSSMVVVATKNG